MRVDPDPQWLWIWRAWHRLSGERQETVFGMMVPLGGGMIESRPGFTPWSIVRLWAEHHGFSDQEMALLDRCIVAMDRVYFTHWAKKQESRTS